MGNCRLWVCVCREGPVERNGTVELGEFLKNSNGKRGVNAGVTVLRVGVWQMNVNVNVDVLCFGTGT